MIGMAEHGGSPRNGLACKNCRQRKRKCDRQVPRCGLCARRNLDCVMQVIKSADTQEGSVQSLEREIANLEAQLSRLQTTMVEPPLPTTSRPQNNPAHMPCETPITSITSREQSLDSVDLDVLKEVETVSLYRGELYCLHKMARRALRLENYDPRGMLNLTQKKSLLASYSRPPSSNSPLDYDLALSYASKYFSYIHPTFPVVSEDAIRKTLRKIANGTQSDLRERTVSYLVISIGAILPLDSFAAFDTYNSADYFLRSLDILYSYDESATTVQILLLFTICSLFDPSMGSSWHLIDLAMQACIDMGYHQLQPEVETARSASVQGSMLFQTAYVLDFTISSALGLPMGIQNRDISFDWEARIVQPTSICASGSKRKELSLVEIFSWTYDLCSSPKNDAAGYISRYEEHILQSRLSGEEDASYLPRVFELQLVAQSLRRSLSIGSTSAAQGKLILNCLASFQSAIHIWAALPWITGYNMLQLALLGIFFSNGMPQSQRVSQISHLLSMAGMVLSVMKTKFSGLHPHSVLLGGVSKQITSFDTDSRQNINFLEGSNLYEFCRDALNCVDIDITL
ncbi:hypothetical protein ACQKWADRAFT_294322 [Trichoderma austrokoningii]